MTQTKSVIRAVAKYDKTNTQGLYIKLHKTKDKDIIDKLESVESKQGYIKKLIMEDMQMTDVEKISLLKEAVENYENCEECQGFREYSSDDFINDVINIIKS